jgi:hypothetical protein
MASTSYRAPDGLDPVQRAVVPGEAHGRAAQGLAVLGGQAQEQAPRRGELDRFLVTAGRVVAGCRRPEPILPRLDEEAQGAGLRGGKLEPPVGVLEGDPGLLRMPSVLDPIERDREGA